MSFDYKRLDSPGGPPSYDDVVSNPQPSAPPPSEIGPPAELDLPYVPQHAVIPPSPNPPDPSVQNESHSKLRCLISSYITYSMAHHLRKYIIPKSSRLDPELDVEAKFSRRTVHDAQSRIAKGMRLQCVTGWLWCFGFIQVILYILLPIGMLVVGGIGFNDCPHRSNAIIIYLLLGGSVVTLFVFTRILPSLMTCFRSRNYLNTGKSGPFTLCICVFEFIFYIVLAVNLVMLILGTVFIFQGSIPTCSSSSMTDCCYTYVRVSSAFFNLFQYVMYTISAVYVCLVVGCVRNMDHIYGRR